MLGKFREEDVLQKLQKLAALTHALKKAWDEIILDEVRDICTAALRWIKAVI